MDNLSSLIKDVEGELCRELDYKELEFLKWLFQQHIEEKQMNEYINNSN